MKNYTVLVVLFAAAFGACIRRARCVIIFLKKKDGREWIALIIGLDGGGTKNAYCLADTDGRVLRMKIYPGTNAAEMGAARAAEIIEGQLKDLTEGFGGLHAPYDAFYAGISGGGSASIRQELRAHLIRMLPKTQCIDNASDALNAFYAEAGGGCGISVISGTGSVSFGVTAGGVFQTGGWGPLIDDAGSGFVIAREGLMYAYRFADGRGEETILKALFEAEFGAELPEAIPALYGGGRSGIAALSKIVFRAWAMGDGIAESIVMRAVRALAELAMASAKHFPDEGRLLCAVSGGTFGDPSFRQAFAQALDAGRFDVRFPECPPVIGAVMRAASLCGLLTPAFEKNLKRIVEV